MATYQFTGRKVGSLDVCGVAVDIYAATYAQVAKVARAKDDDERSEAMADIVRKCAKVGGLPVEVESMPMADLPAICKTAIDGKLPGSATPADFTTPSGSHGTGG